MIKCNKLAQANRSSSNITQVLRKDLLGIILEFCNLENLIIIQGLNQKVFHLVRNSKKVPIFSVFIDERKYLRSSISFYKNKNKIVRFFDLFESLERLRARIQNYSSRQVEEILTETVKSFLNVNSDGILYLTNNLYKQDDRYFSLSLSAKFVM